MVCYNLVKRRSQLKKIEGVKKIEKSVLKTTLFVLAMLLLGSCSPEEEQLSHRDFSEKYPFLQDAEHVYVSKTAQEILSAAEAEESFVLWLGFDSCPWCQAIAPVLNEVAKEQHIPEVWYWDPRPFRGDGEQKKHEKVYLEILDLIGMERPEANEKGIVGVSRVSVALLAVINRGHLETFAEAPMVIGAGGLMRDMQGEETSELAAIRYQDGFAINEQGGVLGRYMWDELLTGYQVPSAYETREEWLGSEEVLAPVRKSLRALLKISACGLCTF